LAIRSYLSQPGTAIYIGYNNDLHNFDQRLIPTPTPELIFSPPATAASPLSTSFSTSCPELDSDANDMRMTNVWLSVNEKRARGCPATSSEKLENRLLGRPINSCPYFQVHARLPLHSFELVSIQENN